MFESFEKFRVAFKQKVLIAALEHDEDFGIFKFRSRRRSHRLDFKGSLRSGPCATGFRGSGEAPLWSPNGPAFHQRSGSDGRRVSTKVLLAHYFFFPGPRDGFAGGGAVR